MIYRKIKAKKSYGQHFLEDDEIAQKIAHTITNSPVSNVLEIGAGTGLLTRWLLPLPISLKAIEIEPNAVRFLQQNYPNLSLISEDFLRIDLTLLFEGKPFAIIGNFPYNISSQILFRVLDNHEQVPFFSGMFQKEVAQRICASPNNKSYGVLSVLTQARYHTEYLFSVSPSAFRPPPKVESGIIQLVHKKRESIRAKEEETLRKVVKSAFNQRRKKLSNSLRSLFGVYASHVPHADKRPEQLGLEEFLQIVTWSYDLSDNSSILPKQGSDGDPDNCTRED